MHWLDLKGWLSVVGLICDLIGAGMLAIPMLSSAEAVAARITAWRRRLLIWHTVQGQLPTRPTILEISFVVMLIVMLFFSISKLELFNAQVGWTIARGLREVAIMTILFATFYLLSTLISKFIAASLAWVAAGVDRSRERKMGWIGYGILSVGFTLQAVVNFLPSTTSP
ncbi:hypothetical protein [Desertibaculum subflavum]|uniref:hypothetical protein n=1 Tax=Desertibaculum subflavum TaxID=2268458 RepID=UPI000E6640EB